MFFLIQFINQTEMRNILYSLCDLSISLIGFLKIFNIKLSIGAHTQGVKDKNG
ncbi:hypothetical protein ES703_50403 [subsurface metagenome]